MITMCVSILSTVFPACYLLVPVRIICKIGRFLQFIFINGCFYIGEAFIRCNVSDVALKVFIIGLHVSVCVSTDYVLYHSDQMQRGNRLKFVVLTLQS